MSEYENYTTEQLKDLEQFLYNAEVNGDNEVWFDRDKILWELSSRES